MELRMESLLLKLRSPKVLVVVFTLLTIIGVVLGGIWIRVCIGLALITFAIGTVGGVLSRKTKGIQRVVDISVIILVLILVISILLGR